MYLTFGHSAFRHPALPESALAGLSRDGLVVVPGVIPPNVLALFREAVAHCAAAIDASFSYSVRLDSLSLSREELLSPVRALRLDESTCRLEHCWTRKRFAPCHAPRLYHPNSWHQDGGLGVVYPPEPGSPPPMTQVLTCWVPLQDCTGDRPGLEFIRQPLDALLHYTELADPDLRRRFPSERFWAPELKSGDAILFLPGTLHRTHVLPAMRHNRLSLEYRFL